jgi:hypothetical protein
MLQSCQSTRQFQVRDRAASANQPSRKATAGREAPAAREEYSTAHLLSSGSCRTTAGKLRRGYNFTLQRFNDLTLQRDEAIRVIRNPIQ